MSVPSNIAEGCGRRSIPDLSRFLDMSMGSLCELETQVYLSYDLELMTKNEMNEFADEAEQIRRMITAYQRKL